MGKVFTWSEIKNNQVPTLPAFELVAEQMRLVLNNSSIAAALMCGSVLCGTHSTRSDIDCVVFFEDGDAVAAFDVIRGLVKYASEHHVPLELIINTVKMAQDGIHNLNPLFVDHLRLSMERGGVIKGDVFNFFKPLSLSKQDDARQYIANKLFKLRKGWLSLPFANEWERVKILKDMLDVSAHVARKVLQVSSDALIAKDNKTALLPAYRNLAGNSLGSIFESIALVDRNYSSELQSQIDGPCSRKRYESSLCAVTDVYPLVLDFLSFNARFLMGTSP